MAGIFDLNFGGILDGIGNSAVKIRTALTGVDPAIAGQIQLEVIKLEEQINAARPIIAQAEAADRTSARTLGAEYIKTGKINWRQNILATLAMVSLIGFIVAVFTIGIKPEIRDIAMMVLGGLLKIVYDIYGYDFGGSLGSEQKNDLISSVLDKFKK
jgi:hypothetical protein